MTQNELKEATSEAVGAAAELVAHIGRLRARMQNIFPLTGDALARWDDEHRERLHALLRMFDQLYDLTTRKLLRGLLALSGEPIAGLSAQNQFRRAEAIGGLPGADRWMELARPGTCWPMTIRPIPRHRRRAPAALGRTFLRLPKGRCTSFAIFTPKAC